jgi:glycerol-3-phosphate dehydrogenase (NAD(P)+)
MSIVLSRKGHRVVLWARRQALCTHIEETRLNEVYLPGVAIPEEIEVTSDLATATHGAELLVFAVPTQSLRDVARQIDPGGLNSSCILVSLAKGIENTTLLTPTGILHELLAPVEAGQIAVVSGPSHAEEVAVGLPTTLVAASTSENTTHVVQATMMTERLRMYTNQDVIGVEIAAAVKNVMAIAAGISDGVGYGDNAKAAIITRGIAEIARLGMAMGAKQETFGGLSGIGDLVVTCASRHSRNRFVGEQIGRGRRLAEIQAEMHMVAEGVRTTLSTVALANRLGVDMPITRSVFDILFNDKRPDDAVRDLMSRSAKQELWMPSFDCTTSSAAPAK